MIADDIGKRRDPAAAAPRIVQIFRIDDIRAAGAQDNFVRDYLIERIEDMLSHRVLSGLYPRLGLAPGQRFASKGGYIVHLTEFAGTQIAADTDWVVP